MRVAIDGRELEGQPTGVGRVLEGLLDCWPAEDRLDLVCRSQPALLTEDSKVRIVLAPGPRGLPGSLWEQLVLPREIGRLEADVLLAPGYSMPRRADCPTAVGMHDCSFMALPETFRFRERLRRQWNARSAARRSAFLFMGTEFAAREAQRHLGIEADRTVVLPYGLGPRFTRPDPAEIDRVKAAHSLPERSILFVGSGLARRSLSKLVAAVEPLLEARPDVGLVLAGRVDAKQRPLLAPHVRLLGYVPEADLGGLYAAATVVAYPSTYEGFGFPVLEALACGTPVVASSAEALSEVYDGHAWLVPHEDEEGWRLAIATLLDDPVEHERRSLSAGDWARGLTWHEAALALRQRLAGELVE